jgi:hypothetical protein
LRRFTALFLVVIHPDRIVMPRQPGINLTQYHGSRALGHHKADSLDLKMQTISRQTLPVSSLPFNFSYFAFVSPTSTSASLHHGAIIGAQRIFYIAPFVQRDQ